MNSVKDFRFNEEASKAILRGVKILSDAVRCTLGPKGRTVVYENPWGGIAVTKDGVTVAKQVILEDEFENVGAQLVRQAAEKTGNDSGDGTTTATILAAAIYTEGLKLIASGVNPSMFKRGIDKAVNAVVDYVDSVSQEVSSYDDIEKIALISANGDEEIAKMIADAMEKTGKDSVITIEKSKKTTTELEIVEGLKTDRGFCSPYFMNNEKRQTIFDDPYIFFYDDKITSQQDMLKILQYADSKKYEPLVVMAQNVEGIALEAMLANVLQKRIRAVPCRAPGYGDMRGENLEDMAVLCGTKVFSLSLEDSFDSLDESYFGKMDRIIVDQDSTTIVGGLCDKAEFDNRIEFIRNQIAGAEGDWKREQIEKRLANLLGGVAVISVGGSSDVEIGERLDRTEDALCSTKSASEDGVVPGGGTVYIRASGLLDDIDAVGDEKYGIDIIKKALRAPLDQICNNAGIGADIVIDRVENGEGAFGYNARTDEFGDLLEFGVIDPAKVVKLSLQNAASVAGTMLSTDVIIVKKKEENKDKV